MVDLSVFYALTTKSITDSLLATIFPVAVHVRSYRPNLTLKYGCNPHQKPAGVYSLQNDGKLPFTVLNGNFVQCISISVAAVVIFTLVQTLVLANFIVHFLSILL